MTSILITGFEPFHDNKINPSQEVALALNNSQICSFSIKSLILPVSFEHSHKLITQYLLQQTPQFVLLLGLDNQRNHLSLERIAVNFQAGKDNDNVEIDGSKIIDKSNNAFFSTLPIVEINNQLNKNKLFCKCSNHAGVFLCNQVLFHTLSYIKKKNLNSKCGFIHLPLTQEMSRDSSWTIKQFIRAIEICIHTIV